MGFSQIIILLLLFSQSAFSRTANHCSRKSIQSIISNLKKEFIHSKSPALRFGMYTKIDEIMMCDIQGKLKKQDKTKVLNILNKIKISKPTLFVWASSKGVDVWNNGLSKLTFLPEEIRNTLPVILSQLNSSIVTFVPSETGDRSTNYNFESDLDIDLFGPWDRRNCNGIPNHDLQRLEKDLKKSRISKKDVSNFTRNYSAIEVSKIGVHQSPTCYWYKNSNQVECRNEFDSSIIHEALHLLETRYPLFINTLHNAKGGYKDRLKLAQKVVPAFGVTKCTPEVWEEHCTEGVISQEEVKKIIAKTSPPQDEGSIVGRHYARRIDPNAKVLHCYNEVVKQGNDKYCVNKGSESLYTYVRGGEEYISVLLEKAIVDPLQFKKVASEEEKKLFRILQMYIF